MSTPNPYTDDRSRVEFKTFTEKAEHFAEHHTQTAIFVAYAVTLLACWLLGFAFREPRADLGSDEMQVHWVPVLVHGCLATIAGGIAAVDDTLTPKGKLKVLALVGSALLMILVSALVEVFGR